MAYTHCPKCGHSPLPQDQALPAAWTLWMLSESPFAETEPD